MKKLGNITSIPFRGISIGAVLAFFLVFLPREGVSPFVTFVLGLFIGLAWVSHYEASEGILLTGLFLGAYAIRAFLSTLFYFLSFAYQDPPHVGFLFLNDGWAFQEDAFRMVQMIHFGFAPTQGSIWAFGKDVAPLPYMYWNCYVYFFSGKSPLTMFILNSFFGSLILLVAYDFVRHLFGKRAAFRAACLCAFWPSLILWSTQNLKDPLISFSLLLLISSLLTIVQRPTFFRLGSLLLGGLILLHLQRVLLLVILLLAIFAYFISLKIHRMLWMRIFWFSFLAACFLAYAIHFVPGNFVVNTMTRWQNYFIRYYDIQHKSEIFSRGFQTLNSLRQVRAQGGSAFLKNLNITSPLSFLLFLPLLLCYAWFGPFPWQAFGFFKFFAAAEMIVFYFFMPAFLRGIKKAFQTERTAALLLLTSIFTIILLIALLDANMGTAFRHRSNIIGLIFVFIAIGWEKSKEASR